MPFFLWRDMPPFAIAYSLGFFLRDIRQGGGSPRSTVGEDVVLYFCLQHSLSFKKGMNFSKKSISLLETNILRLKLIVMISL